MINKFNIKEVRDFWDKVADIYEEENKKVGYVHYHRYEKAIEYGNFRSGQKVLNIWSRMGGFIPYIRKIPQIELMNYEVSPKFIEQAKIKFRNEDFSQTDLENLEDLQDDYFDRVVSLETLEHAPKPLEFVKELYRVLKPGGLLIMSLPPKGFEIPTMLWDFFAGNHGEGPHNFLWPYQVKKIINDSSFKSILHIPTIILPLGSERGERLSEKCMMRFFGRTPLVNFGVRHFYICKK